MNSEKESLKETLSQIDRVDIINFIIAATGIVILNLGLYEVLKIINAINLKIIILGVILNFIIIYQATFLFMNKVKIRRLNRYVEYLNLTNESLMELNDNIRCFKHDFNNIIQAIDGYILIGDMEALKVYFSKLLEECNHVKNLELLTCSQIKNPAIYGILINKYKLAEQKNIKMNIDVLMDFSGLNNKSYFLSRVIGILLDNAIEGALESNRRTVHIQFSQEFIEGTRSIIVENSYDESFIDTEKIFEKEYSTKKKKGNSGIGLWKVRNMIEKEEGIDLTTTTDKNMFKQEIKLFF